MTNQFFAEADNIFSHLCDEKEREYEKAIANFAEKSDDPKKIAVLNEMADGEYKYGFEAFFCLSIIYRRKKDFSMLKNLIDSHQKYKGRCNYNHIYISYLVHSETFFDYDELLRMAYHDALAFPNNSGYQQAFCNAFATIAEQCDAESRKSIVDEWYDLAIQRINLAIEMDPNYAKYYCTKGRILSQVGRFSEAIALINLAVSLENSLRPDYSLVVQTYENYKNKVLLRYISCDYEEKIEQLQGQIDELVRKMENSSSKTLNSVEDKTLAEKEEMDNKANEKYAFVSYSHKDREEVLELIQILRQQGINIWFDEQIELGSEWKEEIAKHIQGSSMVIVMLSSNAVCSRYVRKEVNFASSIEKPLLLVKLDEVVLSPGMRLDFGMYQRIDRFRYEKADFITKMAEAIRKGV